MDMRLVFQGVQVLLTLWAAWYAWSTARQAARQNEVNTLAAGLADIATRVTRLEQDVRHLPDQEFVSRVAGELASIQANVEGLRREIAPLAHQMGLLNQYLLNHK